MKRRAIVGAVMVLHKELVIEFESDEELQAEIVRQLQGDGMYGWNRQAFEPVGMNVEIAEVRQRIGDALPVQPQQLAG